MPHVILVMIFSSLLSTIADAVDHASPGTDIQALELGRSPENQVFQFMTTQTFTPPGKPPVSSTGYLWIPPNCRRVRGVVVLGQNVPEQMLAGHTGIRQACTDTDLAILFTCRSMRIFNNTKDFPDAFRMQGQFLQQILDALATESGYSELSMVPWLPMGESMSLLLVNALSSAFPERCIAAVQIKDGQWDRLASPGVPALIAAGTAAEWEQHTFDISSRWQVQATENHANHVAKRTKQPEWPGSLAIEGGSAHFSCTEPMARLIADYIRAAARARLPMDASQTLRPIDLASGYVAALPVPGVASLPPIRYADATPEQRRLPWYFDSDGAKAAHAMASIDWKAKSALPAFADAAGAAIPFGPRGITQPVPISFEDDGITFRLAATFLDRLPDHFVKGGTALGRPTGEPSVGWLCGPFVPLGQGRFRLALDRSWNNTNYFARIWHVGDDAYRFCTCPGEIKPAQNQQGREQLITFDAIPDQRADATGIRLLASSSANLPVHFFVRAGPAIIHGDRLTCTAIPVRAKMPVTVTVVAWQWGRSSAPAVQTAKPVERSFTITPR